MPDWVVEDLTRERVPAAAEMYCSHYGPEDDIADPEYLDYEYYQNPAGPTLGELAWNAAKQEAAGGYALVTVNFRVGGKDDVGFHGPNSMTRADYRKQGVYASVLHRAVERGEDGKHCLIYGMPNQNSYPQQTKNGLFKDLGAIPLYLRPLRPSGMVREYLHSGFLSTLARPFDGLFKPGEATGQFVKLTDENLELADKFWAAVKDKYPVMVVRDSVRTAYRFLHIPRRKYECWYALEKGEPVAMAIGRNMEVAGIQCAMIGDFLYLDGHEAQARALLRKVMAVLQEQGGDMAGCLMLPNTGESKVLRRAGFFRCPKFMEPQPFRLCVRRLREQAPDEPDLMELRNWFFTMGDYDVV